jgi:hypothetical protein
VEHKYAQREKHSSAPICDRLQGGVAKTPLPKGSGNFQICRVGKMQQDLTAHYQHYQRKEASFVDVGLQASADMHPLTPQYN